MQNLSDSGCRSLSIRQRMQTLFQRADAEVYQTADAGDTIRHGSGDTLTASGCRSLSIRQRMQETLNQTADAEVSLSDSG